MSGARELAVELARGCGVSSTGAVDRDPTPAASRFGVASALPGRAEGNAVQPVKRADFRVVEQRFLEIVVGYQLSHGQRDLIALWRR